MDEFTKANRALFDGNRGEIPTLVKDLPESGRKLWLLASAEDNEQERKKLLEQVMTRGEQPYADMARGILEREQMFAKQMKRVPRWQEWLQRNSRTISLISTAVFVILVVLALLWPRMFPPPPQAAGGPGSTRAAGESTATPPPTPTVTPYPGELRTSASYAPVGSLTILNVEFPTKRPVTSGTGIIEPPAGAVFLAIQYEFTCGTAHAFCNNPPEAGLGLELADTRLGLIPNTGLALSGSAPLPPMASGISAATWVVFPVPQNQTPLQLVVLMDTDGDNQADQTLKVPLPR
jgi:hypothetical protein